MNVCACTSCVLLQARVEYLETALAAAEAKNRAAAGLLGDLGMLATRADAMVDVLLGDAPMHERPTLPEIGASNDTEPPPAEPPAAMQPIGEGP